MPSAPFASAAPPARAPSLAFWLVSVSGLVPFLACLGLGYARPDLREAAVHTFLVYAALTLSFLGGARWGAELVRAPDAPIVARLVLAATPSVIGLMALLPQTPSRLALVLLMSSGIAQLLWDLAAGQRGLLPTWNGRVRTVLTVAGTACSAALWPLLT